MTVITITASVLVVIFMGVSIWFNVMLLKRLLRVSDNMDDLLDSLTTYSNHLEQVYGMETYYGDQTLSDLLDHSREVVDDVMSFNDTYGGRPGDRSETETQTS